MKKYKLTDETIEYNGHTLYRIEALKDFADVKAGDKGGYIESENNLSQYNKAWVYENAKVFGKAWVYENAKVFGNARVYGNAWVFDNAMVCDNAEVCENAWVSEKAKVFDNARVYGNAWVSDKAKVSEDSSVLWISRIGSRFGTTTAFTNKDGGVSISCGCFSGTLDEFEKKVDATHGDNKYGKEYRAFIELIKMHFEVGNGG